MRWFLVLVLVAAAWAEDVLPLAAPCDPEACQLPACRCSSTNIPGGLNARDVPQFVLLTFDDEVNVTNINTYRDLIYNRRNTNGCPVGTTFYINHVHTDYTMVNEQYNRGFEIALHSISHRSPSSFWAQATYEDMRMEFGDQRILMSHFANIPYDAIKGVRLPFLQMTGNTSFQVMADYGLQYDCSWPTINQLDPGLWPYTLHYATTQECVIQECPTASIPGVWVLPMVSWRDLIGQPCLMADYCMNAPPGNDEDAWFNFILTNFERHYLGNRSPFGIYIHEVYFAANPVVREAVRRFLNMINKIHDVFMVNSADVIEWVQNPVSLADYKLQPCKTFIPTTCPANSCGPLSSDHNDSGSYWMQVCNVCPNVYPWVGNPLGQ